MFESNEKRRRGGQKGNKNALKHGLYAESLKIRAIRQSSGDVLDEVSLRPEIELIRMLIRRTLADMGDGATPAQNLITLRVVSHAVHELTSIMRAQSLFELDSDDEGQEDAELARILAESARSVEQLQGQLDGMSEEVYNPLAGFTPPPEVDWNQWKNKYQDLQDDVDFGSALATGDA